MLLFFHILHYRLIAIDLSNEIELENSDLKQQINFVGQLTRDEEATMFFIIENQKKQLLNFHKMLQQFLSLTTYNNGNIRNCEFIG